MKKRIFNLFMLVTLAFSSLFATGCDLFSFLKDDDVATLEDFFTALRNSNSKTEYAIDYVGSSQVISDEDSEPYIGKAYYTKSEDGFYSLFDSEDGKRASTWTKSIDPDTNEVYYAGSIWLRNYTSWDGLHNLSQEEFDEQYGNISNLITVFTASSMGDLFGLAYPDGEVEVEGTYEYEITKNNKNNVLKFSVKDYIVEMELSSTKSYQKIDMDMEFTFADGYVSKIILDYIESRQDKKEDGTFVDSTALFSWKTKKTDVYNIKYSFDLGENAILEDVVEYFDIIGSSGLKNEYTIGATHTITKVSGYDAENGSVSVLNTMTTYKEDEGYFYHGDLNEQGDEIWGQFYQIVDDEVYAYVCDGNDTWCDGLGNYTKEDVAEMRGQLYLSGLPVIHRIIGYLIGDFAEINIDRDVYLECIEVEDSDFSYDIITKANQDKELVLNLTGFIVEKDERYSYGVEPIVYERNGSVKITYNDSGMKKLVVTTNDEELELDGEEYVKTGKVLQTVSEYNISYTYDSTVINMFPQQYIR